MKRERLWPFIASKRIVTRVRKGNTGPLPLLKLDRAVPCRHTQATVNRRTRTLELTSPQLLSAQLAALWLVLFIVILILPR